MKQERWREIDRICNSAMDLPPEERLAFVRNECAGDERQPGTPMEESSLAPTQMVCRASMTMGENWRF